MPPATGSAAAATGVGLDVGAEVRARAIGVQRGHLVRMFVTEGMIYDLLAAALGVLLGLLVAWLMVGWVSGLFNSIGEQFGS